MMTKVFAAFVTALVFSGCLAGSSSGSSSGGSSSTAFEGVYLGSSSTADFQSLILENGDFWSIYGRNTSVNFSVRGFIQGSGSSNNGTFTSTNLKDFGSSPALAGSLTATYDASLKKITGSTTFNSSSTQFNATAPATSAYNYDSAPSLSNLVGMWTVDTLTGERLSLNLASSGSFTFTGTGGCTGTGHVTPRPSGKNVFNVSLTFGGSPCLLPGQTATGIAINYLLPTGQMQLTGAIVDANRTFGTAIIGVR